MSFRCLECNAFINDEAHMRTHNCPPPLPPSPLRVARLEAQIREMRGMRNRLQAMLDKVECYCPVPIQDEIRAERRQQADALATADLVASGGISERLKVPNTTESERRYARRALYDLANILQHLGSERWDDPGERAAVLRGLDTHADVLYRIANHIDEVGEFAN